jgi:hypothetical protein
VGDMSLRIGRGAVCLRQYASAPQECSIERVDPSLHWPVEYQPCCGLFMAKRRCCYDKTSDKEILEFSDQAPIDMKLDICFQRLCALALCIIHVTCLVNHVMKVHIMPH